MRIISIVKTLAYLLLISHAKSICEDNFQDICQQSLPTLPPECDSFEVIKGNPFTAKTLIFGEVHKVCDSVKISCTQGLLSTKKNKKTTILLEMLGHDQKILCEEMGYEKFSDDCRGWNLPKKQNDVIQTIFLKKHVFTRIFEVFHTKLKELESKPEHIQLLEATIFIKMYVANNRQHLQNSKNEYAEFVKKHPDFYSYKHVTLEQNKFRQKILKIISKKIIEDKATMHEIMLYIMKHANKYIDSYNTHWLDPIATREKPNEAMVETIKKYSNKKKTVIVYAGDAHVNLFHTRRTNLTDQGKQIVQNLYNKLDEFASENPYAVLSCKL